MDLSTIILPEHVFVGLAAPTKWRALQMLSSKAASCFGLDEAMVLRVLEAREKLGTTGIGNGVAVPHAAIAGMTRPRGLMVHFAHAVDFEAIDDIPDGMGVRAAFRGRRTERLSECACRDCQTAADRGRSDGDAAGQERRRTLFGLHVRLHRLRCLDRTLVAVRECDFTFQDSMGCCSPEFLKTGTVFVTLYDQVDRV